MQKRSHSIGSHLLCTVKSPSITQNNSRGLLTIKAGDNIKLKLFKYQTRQTYTDMMPFSENFPMTCLIAKFYIRRIKTILLV